MAAVAVLVVAGVAIWVGQDDGPAPGGCDGVREAVERARAVEASRDLPTAETYAEAGQAIRRAAMEAPSGVSPDLHALADAYGELGHLYRGFDAEDPATYALLEQRTPDIERYEARVTDLTGALVAWLQERCPPDSHSP